jgi:alkylation response protein AidB-like acyl-CoA dehydrogenase
LRRFLVERVSVATHVRPLIDGGAQDNREVWSALVALGAVGLLVPAHLDGAGLSMTEAGVAAEEFGAGLYCGPWLSSSVAAVRALTRLDSGAAGEALLTGISTGSMTVTIAGLLGDAQRPTVEERDAQAVLVGDVDGVRDLDSADVVLVFAEESTGTALFAVQTEFPEVRTEPRESIDPTARWYRLHLSAAPAQRIASASPQDIESISDDLLIATAADALGAARAVLELAVDYAKVRHQFGKPIGAFQAVQHLCADMYETVELARSGVLHALWAADAADRTERHLAALRSKGFATNLVGVADTAIQIFGGVGFTWEHDAHLYLKRLLGFSELAGNPDEYLQKIGAHLARQSMAKNAGEQG